MPVMAFMIVWASTYMSRHCCAQGFFADSDAGAKASGQPVPKKKAPAEEYADFLKAISGDVREVDRREDEEASDAALERTRRDDFEQRCAGGRAGGSGAASEP